MKITQLVALSNTLYGIGDDGKLYMFNFGQKQWVAQEAEEE